jgi:hypothetical protein
MKIGTAEKRIVYIVSIILSLIVIISSVAVARMASVGGKPTATTTTAQATGFTVDWLSVHVDDDATNDVFFLTDVATNAFNTALAAGTAIPIKPGKDFLWTAGPKTVITNLTWATTNGEALFRWGGAQAVVLE